jgi:AcrR family transcriptional regulator
MPPLRYVSNLGEAQSRRLNHRHSDLLPENQNMRTERVSKENDTRELIIEVAERLFQQVGFQKTTVGDIARELHMSSANVYRFFAAKSEINEAVCMDVLGKFEVEAERIAASPGPAAQRLRNLIRSIEKTHRTRYSLDRKLHDLVEVAITENWPVMGRHKERMAAIMEQIIARGMAMSEFPRGDAALAARLVNTACLRFCHPRLIAEYEQEHEPTIDQMVGFCLMALARQTLHFAYDRS